MIQLQISLLKVLILTREAFVKHRNSKHFKGGPTVLMESILRIVFLAIYSSFSKFILRKKTNIFLMHVAAFAFRDQFVCKEIEVEQNLLGTLKHL